MAGLRKDIDANSGREIDREETRDLSRSQSWAKYSVNA
jgi:hypothetical protein